MGIVLREAGSHLWLLNRREAWSLSCVWCGCSYCRVQGKSNRVEAKTETLTPILQMKDREVYSAPLVQSTHSKRGGWLSVSGSPRSEEATFLDKHTGSQAGACIHAPARPVGQIAA